MSVIMTGMKMPESCISCPVNCLYKNNSWKAGRDSRCPLRDDEIIELGDEVQIKKTGMVGHVVNIYPENDKVLYLIKCYVDGFREYDNLTLDEFKLLRKKIEVTDEAPYVKQYRRKGGK